MSCKVGKNLALPSMHSVPLYPLMRLFSMFLLLGSCTSAALSQTEVETLRTHSGALLADLTGLHVTQRSAKPNGQEIGVRAHDAGTTELLIFLFVTPDQFPHSAASCLDEDLKPLVHGPLRPKLEHNPLHAREGGSDTATLTYPNGNKTLYKYFGDGDQCVVLQAYADKGQALDLPSASALLNRQHYNPEYRPTLEDATRYQSVLGRQIMATSRTPLVAPRMLVGWSKLGGNLLPTSRNWQLQALRVNNNGARPSAEFRNMKTNVIVSFIISENLSRQATAESCRDDVMTGIRRSEGELLSQESQSTFKDIEGQEFSAASHMTQLSKSTQNHDMFLFAGNADSCAEIHVSTVAGMAQEESRLDEALKLFHPDLSYPPVCSDLVVEANAFYKSSPISAAPFYDACLKLIPAKTQDPTLQATRRLATDQIVIALGLTGKLNQSRDYAERAIKLDPDYPLNYYNLACADAESGNVADARSHLQQAYDRRANTLKGESMPNASKDESIGRLRNNKAFWTFVLSLNGG